MELLAVDRYHYRRCHAWVVIINNAPWSIKPKITYTDVPTCPYLTSRHVCISKAEKESYND